MERLRRENQQLQKTVSQLELQVEELGLECNDLREICAANSISVGDALAARRHHRMFVRARADHPLGSMRASSEVLSALEISHYDSRKHRISENRKHQETRRHRTRMLHFYTKCGTVVRVRVQVVRLGFCFSQLGLSGSCLQ